MEITKPDQLLGHVAREMRMAAGMTQSQFWGPLGVSKSRASTYENGVHPIDAPVQLLLYLRNVCGFPISDDHQAMVAAGSAARAALEGGRAIKSVVAPVTDAINELSRVKARILGEK